MTILFWLVTSGILVWGAALTWQVVWSRDNTWKRGFALLTFILMVPSVAVLSAELLGHHRPMTWESIKAMGQGDIRVRILGHKMVYGQAIYLYLDQAGEPLSLVLPWSISVAEDLEEAMRQKGRPMIILPYEWSWDKKRKPEFRVLPPPKMPDKPLEDRRAPPTYERGAENQWRDTDYTTGTMTTSS